MNPSCRFCSYKKSTCSDCQRLEAYGAIVDAAVGNGHGFDVLDALASLMGAVTRERRRHNRELLEESLEGQRAARDAYAEGHHEGRSEGSEW